MFVRDRDGAGFVPIQPSITPAGLRPSGRRVEGHPVIPQATHRSRGARALRVTSGIALVALALSGCTREQQRGFLPGPEDGVEVTNQTERITSMWTGSWATLQKKKRKQQNQLNTHGKKKIQ
jgi:hypothetical protein